MQLILLLITCLTFYSQVNMGVLHKNEQYEDDMVEILEWLHKCVPNHCISTDGKEGEIKQPVNTLSGGDYLTFERHKGAQSSMQDSRTPSTRLEGLIPKIEDFHMQAEWHSVSFVRCN